MDQSIPPAQTQPTPTPPSGVVARTVWYKTIMQKLLVNKSLSIFSAMMVVTFAMGGYIIMAPESKTVSNRASAYVPPKTTPFPTDTPLPSFTPTPTPTPEAPEEIVEEEPTPIPTEMPTPTPTSEPAASWNTYINAEYGYTIRYPLDWTAFNLGVLEPKVPSYVAFNMNTATQSARSITISVSTRTSQEQVAIGGTTAIPYTVGSTVGIWQNLRDSDGNTSVSIVLPRTDNILILRAKSAYISTLIQMLPTLYLTE
jgi:hypothetical protein